MKKFTFIIYSFLFVFVGNYSIIGQEINVGSKWYYDYWDDEHPQENNYMLYDVTKDTIVGDSNCYKIEGNIYFADQSTPRYQSGEIVHISNKKFFVWVNNKFHLLFDFNAQPGDTITVIDEPFQGFFEYLNIEHDCFEYYIDSIGYINNKDDSVKLFYTSPTERADWFYNQPLLDNIGPLSLDGATLFGNSVKTIPVAGPLGLRCFDALHLVDYACDNLGPVGYADVNFQYEQYVYPNPTKGELNLNDAYDVAEVYNLLGYKVGYFTNCKKINLGDLPAGTYFICLSSGGNRFMGKIIKE